MYVDCHLIRISGSGIPDHASIAGYFFGLFYSVSNSGCAQPNQHPFLAALPPAHRHPQPSLPLEVLRAPGNLHLSPRYPSPKGASIPVESTMTEGRDLSGFVSSLAFSPSPALFLRSGHHGLSVLDHKMFPPESFPHAIPSLRYGDGFGGSRYLVMSGHVTSSLEICDGAPASSGENPLPRQVGCCPTRSSFGLSTSSLFAVSCRLQPCHSRHILRDQSSVVDHKARWAPSPLRL